MLLLISVLSIAAVQTPDSVVLEGDVRAPTFSTTGRLAFERGGDLWTVQTRESGGRLVLDGIPVRVTAGSAWDRQPAWAPDGGAVIFSSNRGEDGVFHLWSVEIDVGGRPGAVRQLTNGDAPDTEPVVAPDGAIIFVRGPEQRSDLWVRSPVGAEERLTDHAGAEVSPTLSPNGEEVAYVAVIAGRRELHRRPVGAGRHSVVLSNRQVEWPRWSPSGDRLVFTTREPDAGVWITTREGGYVNLVAALRAAAAWAPDAAFLALAEVSRGDLSYNGDPDRVGDREIGSMPSGGRFWMARAPQPPAADLEEVTVRVAPPRAEHAAEVFDRVWDRLAMLYYAAEPARREWQRLRDRYRPRVLNAADEPAVRDVVHQLLRDRPTIRQEVRGRAAVSSAHPLATAAGIEILREGGNVIDAAVAVSFALGVVEPDASGIGGYGEMVLSLTHMEAPVVVEFLTRVPEQATLSDARYAPNRLPSDGPILANVPGTVAGMHEAWQRYGSGVVAWSRLLEPAVRLAEQGYQLDDAFTTTLRVERDRFLKYESSRALFFPDGEPLQAGDTLRNPDLAWTLRQIAEGGARAFYDGAIADKMVEDLRGKGNAMTRADLSRYFAAIREPVRGTYRGHTIYSGAPAVSGGAILVGKLHLLEQAERTELYTEDAATLHAMIEAWKLAPSTSGRVADPSLWPVNLEPFESRDSARVRWERCFDPNASTGPLELNARRGGLACLEDEVALSPGEDDGLCDALSSCRAAGTTAFVVADADGNVVAVTQTLGTWGGNFYVTPGLGFLYNDKLRSYGSDPTGYNARLPYARNTTSIAPTLVFKGTGADRRPFLAVGAAGNAWISSAVYQVIGGVIDGGLGPQRALELPRFLVGVRRDPRDRGRVREVVVQMEDGVSPRVLEQLRAMGHIVQPISLPGELRMGYGAAVVIENREVRAGADPRRSGAAGALDASNIQRPTSNVQRSNSKVPR